VLGVPGAATDPLDSDSDNDTLLDGDEVDSTIGSDFVTNPNASDTDNDGVADNTEIEVDFSDPTNPNSVLLPMITGDLISYYNFDEGTGTTAADTAPKGDAFETAITNQGTVLWDTTAPLIGGASIDFPGNASSLEVEDPFTSETKVFTNSVLIYADRINQARGGIINHRGTEFWGVSTKSEGGTDYRVNNNGHSVPVGTMLTGKWQHVAITWDGVNGVAKTFVDGALEATKTGVSTVFGATSDPFVDPDPLKVTRYTILLNGDLEKPVNLWGDVADGEPTQGGYNDLCCSCRSSSRRRG
jgi:hypothetical protein